MSRHANLPFHIYVNVKNSFLGPSMPAGVTRGIWHAVHSRENQTLMCHVLLASGAHWSGLPLHALSTTENFSIPRELLMPWAAMGQTPDAWHAPYLEGLVCDVLRPFRGVGRHTGIVIDWVDGFSRYPEEHKPLNLIALNTGPFALLPNNYATYRDGHFVDPDAKAHVRHYLRNDQVYWEEP